MAFVLVTENCLGRHLEYIKQDGKFYERGVGREFSGTLALQTFEDRPCMRIMFVDTENLLRAEVREIGGIDWGVIRNDPFKEAKAANEDSALCKFDFSKEDLQLGRKKIRYTLQIYGLSFLAGFICYDLSGNTGCSYIFPDSNIAEKWAREIGLTTVEYLDEDGIVTDVKSLNSTSAYATGYFIIDDSCVSCGMCASICPVGAINEGDGAFKINSEMCIECGVCAGVCPVGAI